ncbi:HTH-type transcriptional regulator [Halarchaeum acidiphilum MH1-52-1]|uniref:HTH-type transcriptional regulator n=1 Tax=Halarchaeum acidiphilum MH1-52-1 TaxID=1261545 RepID=U3A487_9EURY|nr:multiprotein bridging factor aMBF1 [Halarchaeum acidiphilum]GAD52449.1 HTH-type transcriptional regulator [Halarchaeum acidiphilum MH1-52-1]
MVQCEMCGAETANPKTIKVEGAELDVCDDCTEFGTEVKTESSSTTSTKYSTSSSGESSGSSGSSGGSSGGSRRRRRDMFDEMQELASDYDDRIRNAREQGEYSQEDLASELNEKASLVRKLERGDILPSDDVRKKLEKKLGISLLEAVEGDEEWDSGSGEGGLTLGDMVKRKD